MSMREAFRRAGVDVPAEHGRMDAMTAQCGRCGRSFQPRHPSHKLCQDCFRSSRPSGGGYSNRPRRRNIPELPDSYFEIDEGKPCLRTEFVSKNTIDPLAESLANRQLTTGQIRRFFSHCREIERLLRSDDQSWKQVAASFVKLSAHAQYSASSGNIPREFQNFIERNVEIVTSSEDPRAAFLDGFMPHFEALVGFGSNYMKG